MLCVIKIFEYLKCLKLYSCKLKQCMQDTFTFLNISCKLSICYAIFMNLPSQYVGVYAFVGQIQRGGGGCHAYRINPKNTILLEVHIRMNLLTIAM